MKARQMGRRVMGTVAAQRRRTAKKGSTVRSTPRRNEPLQPKERRQLIQLVICGGVFVLLVAVKLLLPDRMAELNRTLTGALARNMDVEAVFSAVGNVFAGEKAVADTVEDVYQAVFRREEEGEALETAAVLLPESTSAIEILRNSQATVAEQIVTTEGSGGKPLRMEGVETDSLVYVLYSEENLPPGVSMEQSILDFAYCTPVEGDISSGFGYRQSAGRFHYGVDLAAEQGSEIRSFADGTVTVVGESSSYGKYCIVEHGRGYSTLYAHCSRIGVVSGAAVKRGQKLGEVGETGMATGPHLHFELQCDGVYLNPVYYVSA
ncbi:MAG: M23 family metallopeptidase [Ruminococcaceae bacterium]|nr:M23 family metallopeptidase [Oscillospiraceae bacterium]